jgi:hypothetical protein
MHGSRLYSRLPVWQVIVGLALTFAVGATAYAQVGGGFDLSWSTVDSGGAIRPGPAGRPRHLAGEAGAA